MYGNRKNLLTYSCKSVDEWIKKCKSSKAYKRKNMSRVRVGHDRRWFMIKDSKVRVKHKREENYLVRGLIEVVCGSTNERRREEIHRPKLESMRGEKFVKIVKNT